MDEIISFLTAGAFVYLGLKVKIGFGDVAYFVLVAVSLVGGFLISHYRT